MVSEAAVCDDEHYNALRTTVPQGCTGLWQISVGTTARVSDHPEYDLFYLQQRTLRLDAWIVWRTGIQTLGAHPVRITDVPRWTLREPALAEAPAVI
jgi:lipopolysaccharide/colanic/teichoic acid biosynthesis glycosyltransferase